MKQLILISSVVLLAACGGSSGSGDNSGGSFSLPGAANFDHRAMLHNIGENVVMPQYADFLAKAQTLKTDVDAYCLDTASVVNKDTAKASWKAAIGSWQQAEFFQFGLQLADNAVVDSRIYSWPLDNACATDLEVLEKESRGASYDINFRSATRRGLDPLEYLLHTQSDAAVCTSDFDHTAWNARSVLERQTLRCDLAKELAADVVVQAQSLVDAWSVTDGNYLATFANASATDTEVQATLKSITDGFFYMDKMTKDKKLGELLPVLPQSDSCSDKFCSELIESVYANESKAHVKANLEGFKTLFEGAGGLGFDDYLIALDQATLSSDMLSALDAAIAADADVSASYSSIVSAATNADEAVCVNSTADTDPATVNNVGDLCIQHSKVKVFTDLLKSSFLMAVSIEAPSDAQGDND